MWNALTALRYRLEYAGFRIAAALFIALPIEKASALSGTLWRLIAPRLRRHQRAVKQLAAAFPEKSLAECEAIARSMWETMGRTFGEFFHLDEIHRGTRIDGADVDATVNRLPEHKGFVACAPHQGNWEIAVMGLAPGQFNAAGLYQRVKNPLVDAWVRQQREKHYPGGLFQKQAASGLKLLRHVRQGGVLAMMADLRDGDGPRVTFFGREAPSTPFPAMVARGLDVPLFAVTIVREPGVRFKISLAPVDVPQTGDREADILRATANLHAAFEASIRRRPEQWMWAHRRWG